MKRLIYLDQEHLYSYYAQAFDGIDKINCKEVSDATISKEDRISEDASRSQNFGFNLGPFQYSASKSTTDDSINSSFLEFEAAKTAATHFLHDNALNRVIEHSKAMENTKRLLGDYVIEKGTFVLIDVQHMLEILTSESLNILLIFMWASHCQDNNINSASPNYDKLEKEYRDKKKKEWTDAKHFFRGIKLIGQFDILLVVNDMLIPLKRSCMKEQAKEITLKYNMPISVFGRITRKDNPDMSESNNPIGELTTSFTSLWMSLLLHLGLLQDRNYSFIDPIAVYVE